MDPNLTVSSHDLICRNLYLGNQASAADKKFMSGVDVVVNCTTHIANVFPNKIIYRIPVFDPGLVASVSDPNITTMFENMVRLCPVINNLLDSGKVVYLHCHAGMQRSAIFCAALLLYRMSKRDPGWFQTYILTEKLSDPGTIILPGGARGGPMNSDPGMIILPGGARGGPMNSDPGMIILRYVMTQRPLAFAHGKSVNFAEAFRIYCNFLYGESHKK